MRRTQAEDVKGKVVWKKEEELVAMGCAAQL